MSNMELWDKVKKPPKDALKEITGGRLRGMTDINPMWRYEALTREFGPCGVGWKFEITRSGKDPGSNEQVIAHVEINLYVKRGGEWSEPIPGVGGAMMVVKEKSGLHTSDEAFKMAVTDALSTACKMLGLGADVYAGKWDGSKYKDETPPKQPPMAEPNYWDELVRVKKDFPDETQQAVLLLGLDLKGKLPKDILPADCSDIVKEVHRLVDQKVAA